MEEEFDITYFKRNFYIKSFIGANGRLQLLSDDDYILFEIYRTAFNYVRLDKEKYNEILSRALTDRLSFFGVRNTTLKVGNGNEK